MKRVYFLVPDVEHADAIVAELRQAGVYDGFIHVIGADTQQLRDHHLHQASIVEVTNAVPAMDRGMLAGAAVGFLAGLAAVALPSAGVVLGGGAVLGLGLFGAGAGAGLGAGISSLVGLSHEDPVVSRLQESIEQGQLLMLVDLPVERETELISLVTEKHPAVSVQGAQVESPARMV